MTTKFQFHNTNWPWLLTGLCEGWKGTCILKVKFHYHIFIQGIYRSCWGSNDTGRMIAIAWQYSWLIQACQIVNLTLSSHDFSWLNQFWLNALMFTNYIISSCLWTMNMPTHTYSCLQISNMIYVHLNILNIKPCMSNLPREIPPPLKPWSVGQVSSSNWSWHWIYLKPGHR